MQAIMVTENKGQYSIHPNAEPENWHDVLGAADNVEFVESLLGWEDYKAAYIVTVGENKIWYFSEQDYSTNAIWILAGLVEGDTYEAVQELETAVLEFSAYGNPDNSIQDWLGNGSYTGDETPQQIAREWDDRSG